MARGKVDLAAVLSAAVLLVGARLPVEAQVVAKQGAPRFDPEKMFQSPMILELPATRLVSLEPRSTWTLPEVRQYKCEDVWLSNLSIQRVDKAKGTLKYEIVGTLMVAESFDRFVTLRFDLLDGERVVGGITKNRVSAEERKATSFSAKFELAPSKSEVLLASGAPKLRLTMSLLKDGAGFYIPPDQTQ